MGAERGGVLPFCRRFIKSQGVYQTAVFVLYLRLQLAASVRLPFCAFCGLFYYQRHAAGILVTGGANRRYTGGIPTTHHKHTSSLPANYHLATTLPGW